MKALHWWLGVARHIDIRPCHRDTAHGHTLNLSVALESVAGETESKARSREALQILLMSIRIRFRTLKMNKIILIA
jgi:hypothetical protein